MPSSLTMRHGVERYRPFDWPPRNLARLLLPLIAPYAAVGICWCVLSNAWLTIIAYHALIFGWSWRSIPGVWTRASRRGIWIGAPAVLAGPILYLLLPHVTRVDLSVWLRAHRLTGSALVAMVPYYGLVHPVLEQVHWAPLRRRTPAAHVLFAGYHLLVLASLLPAGWVAACIATLVVSSMVWDWQVQHCGSLIPAIVSHMLADLGVVLAAWRLAA